MTPQEILQEEIVDETDLHVDNRADHREVALSVEGADAAAGVTLQRGPSQPTPQPSSRVPSLHVRAPSKGGRSPAHHQRSGTGSAAGERAL